MTQTLKDKLLEFIDKNFEGSSKEVEPVVEFDLPKEPEAGYVGVLKATDKKERKALFLVLEPQEGDMTTDLHKDTYTEKEVEKACESFNLHCQKANIFHKVMTEKATIPQSFIIPVEFPIGDQMIKKGSWLQWWHFPEGDTTSDMLWKAVEDNKITGVSIGARAKTEKLDD